jgi:LacI family transcriptional regulator
MGEPKKVALLSRSGVAYFNRLMLGALAYTEVHPQLVTRDFRVPHDFQSKDSSGQQALLNQLRKWNPHGLLCILEPETLARLIQSFQFPVPVVNMVATPPMPGVASVNARFTAMLEMAISHLQQQGLRSFAFLSLEDLPPNTKWEQLFKEIARPTRPGRTFFIEAVNAAIVEDPYAPVAPVPPRLAVWLRHLPKPTGVFIPNVGGGNYLIRACHELGLRVPEDIAVVGVDDTDLALASTPTLTTVLPAAQNIGREAMQLLDEMMRGKPAPKEPVRLNANDLHVRESTGLKRAEICDIAGALEYIQEHGGHGVSVDQVMKETQRVSKVTFHKHFHAATGQTPGEAIQRRQVDEARRLLATTQISITSIAEHCGFCSSSNFARAFHAAQGVTPSAYRAGAKNQARPAPR